MLSLFAKPMRGCSHTAARCMSSFAPPSSSVKRIKWTEGQEFFPNIEPIKYEGPESLNPLAFKHYNPEQVVAGKPMKDWLRFSVTYWHTFRGTGADPFGAPTIDRPWDDGSQSVENALVRCDAAFEFMQKLGVSYYAFHDRDIAPEGHSVEETNDILDTVSERLLLNQQRTGIELLWGTANLFSSPRYMNGAATNPSFDVFAHAGAQVKKAMEITLKLGGSNYVFWGGREGYQSLLNTDVRQELDHLAAFLHMAVKHKAQIGANFQLLIEPKPREPTKHQYDYDAQTVIGFLKHYGLEDHFKCNVEPNHTTLAGHDYVHDLLVASKYGMLGSVDANTGDELLGWDTDQFLTDVRRATQVMGIVLDQGGLAPGGLNFDAKVRRESVSLEDMFIAHISSMDALARGLLNAVRIREEGLFADLIQKRYGTFAGRDLSSLSFEDLDAHARDIGEPTPVSGQQEMYEMLLNRYV